MIKKYRNELGIVIFLTCTCFSNIFSQNLAATPPMGWNSYDCFGYSVHEDDVKANADYMAKYLKFYGWQYIVVDYLWSFDKPAGNTKIPFQNRLKDGSYFPRLSMDEWGRLTPQNDKFPSAADGKGFKPLADYIHSKGLKFGIHIMRGIPRQAVWAKSPIEGMFGITADMIADTNSICTWLNHMFGLDMKKPGAQEYLNSLLNLYASWGVDFIKVDDISFPYRKSEIEGYKKAINQCGRDIILSLSPGPTPLNEATHAIKYANMWRVADDVWDTWDHILTMFDYAKKWEGLSGPTHWPDFDMLAIGKFSKWSPAFEERYSRFTKDELYTLMTLWCICRSPLIIGGNLPENRNIELNLFTNDDVLDVNQHGENPRQLYTRDGTIVWYSHKSGSKDIYVALFNTRDKVQTVTIHFASLGLRGKVAMTNLWEKQDIGVFKNNYLQKIHGHGAALFRLSSIR